MHLVADVLDEQVIDRDDVNAGRVDGIVLRLRPDQPPVVVAIEISPITLLERFSRRLAQWYAVRDRRLGRGRGKPFRVPWGEIVLTHKAVCLNTKVESTPINALEDWLRKHIVEHIPGSS